MYVHINPFIPLGLIKWFTKCTSFNRLVANQRDAYDKANLPHGYRFGEGEEEEGTLA